MLTRRGDTVPRFWIQLTNVVQYNTIISNANYEYVIKYNIVLLNPTALL